MHIIDLMGFNSSLGAIMMHSAGTFNSYIFVRTGEALNIHIYVLGFFLMFN